MVKLGSGSFRKVENIYLSCIACLIIAENADGKEAAGANQERVLQARGISSNTC